MRQAEAATLEAAEDRLTRAATGDASAFAELVRQHQRMVFSIALHFFADRALAEDLAQDVFLQLFQNLRRVESESHLVFWLRQVTSRKCIDHLRWLEKRRHVSLEEIGDRGAPAKTADFLECDRLRRLVAGLPPKFRIVVALRFQEDMQPSEIAEVLGWPVNSVKSRLHRALETLRERL